MTRKAQRWCPRCSTPHNAGQDCPKREPWTTGRKVGTGRGGYRWRKIRQRIFERDDFLCQEHLRQGKLVPVELSGTNHGVCDHIVPKAEGGTDAHENLQTLCQACSAAKTALESARARRLAG